MTVTYLMCWTVAMRPTSCDSVRVLLVADTHLGFDLPFRPRIKRRRRGQDFFANFERALKPALEGKVDLVVHGGDVLYRSRVPAGLVHMAMAPLMKVADQGVPVFVIPGNHERSRTLYSLFAVHPNIHIFDVPRTFECGVMGWRIALSGFPFCRTARESFTELVAQTGYRQVAADLRLLCMHQTIEGAQVGVQNYTFRNGGDVIRGRDVPGGFAAVLTGHIHRRQRLTRDLHGRTLATPVIYPGAVERTSFAERNETKGYVTLAIAPGDQPGGRLVDASFIPLPSRPMVALTIETTGLGSNALAERLRSELSELDPDAVVRIEVIGVISEDARIVLRAANLRSLAPTTMNITMRTNTYKREEDG